MCIMQVKSTFSSLLLSFLISSLATFVVGSPIESDASRNATITFSNPEAGKYYVDGSKIPEVDWDAGPSWSGLMPISSHPNETRKLFFWFWPTNNASHANDVTFWTNGGPGCSSLQGLLTENGPISWNWGQAAPTPNKWSWTNLSHMLWVEQPIGTGFTEGDPTINNDADLAEQFYGFMQQFLEVFSELKGKNFYVSGESFGGFYVPHIAHYIYEHPGLDLHLKGMWLSDPSISYTVVQYEIPTLKFVKDNKNVFPLNSTFMADIEKRSDECGYTDYVDTYVTYPPKGPLPMPKGNNGSVAAPGHCQIRDRVRNAAQKLNPAFNKFRVTDQWPAPWSVLGWPHSSIQKFVYFNRTDVQDAIHAPHVKWEACTDEHVYVSEKSGRPHADTSTPTAFTVLPEVIEKSERVVIAHGMADFMLVAEGTRIAIQNMTWNGAQGFQKPIEPESFTLKHHGVYGNAHTERNLTYVEIYFSGHYVPQFTPWAAYSTFAYLLGRQDSPSS